MAAASVAAQNLGFDGTVIFVLNIQPLIIVFFPLIFRFCRLLIAIISTTYVLVDITVRGVSSSQQYLLAYVTLYNRLNHFFFDVDINVLHAQAS